MTEPSDFLRNLEAKNLLVPPRNLSIGAMSNNMYMSTTKRYADKKK